MCIVAVYCLHLGKLTIIQSAAIIFAAYLASIIVHAIVGEKPESRVKNEKTDGNAVCWSGTADYRMFIVYRFFVSNGITEVNRFAFPIAAKHVYSSGS